MPNRESRDRQVRSGPSARAVFIGVLVVLFVWFAVANLHDVKVTLFVAEKKVSLIVALLISVALGFGVGYLTARARD
jgi:uncharacterized integral membrane protein